MEKNRVRRFNLISSGETQLPALCFIIIIIITIIIIIIIGIIIIVVIIINIIIIIFVIIKPSCPAHVFHPFNHPLIY